MLRALFAAGCVYSAAAFSGSLTLGGSALRSRVRGATTSARTAAGNLNAGRVVRAVDIFADMPAKARVCTPPPFPGTLRSSMGAFILCPQGGIPPMCRYRNF